MRFSVWLFGVIVGVVFKLAYDHFSNDDRIGLIIAFLVVVLIVAIVDAIQSLPDKKEDKNNELHKTD